MAASSQKSDTESNNNALQYYQFEAQNLYSPSPININGDSYLAYEILITNTGNYPFSLDKVEVFAPDHPEKILDSYTSDDLLEMIKSFAITDSDVKATLKLKPGNREVLYFMIPFNKNTYVPEKLVHRFYFKSNLGETDDGEPIPKTFSIVAAPINVNLAPPVIIGQPLRGNHWLAINGPSNTSIHRRARVTNYGIVYFPERFAIDFMQANDDGQISKKRNSRHNEDYYGYGQNIYAVADGTVVDSLDGVGDMTPGDRDYSIDLGNIGGNFLLIDIGNNTYAFYAHMIPHSLTVKKGDHVTKGQIIGKLGNSGNSDAPHLHFHIINRASPLFGEGIPYKFDHFNTEEYSMTNKNEPPLIYQGKATPHTNELVEENTLMDFDKAE